MTTSGKSVDDMIMNLPRHEQVIVKRLRMLVHECLPSATEKGYYDMDVPFYTRHRLICFIWPASVTWGSKTKQSAEKQKAKGVSLGFCQGNLMSNENGILKSEGRKQVYVTYFHSLKDIYDDEVRALLFEAAMIDDMFGEKKKRQKSRKS